MICGTRRRWCLASRHEAAGAAGHSSRRKGCEGIYKGITDVRMGSLLDRDWSPLVRWGFRGLPKGHGLRDVRSALRPSALSARGGCAYVGCQSRDPGSQCPESCPKAETLKGVGKRVTGEGVCLGASGNSRAIGTHTLVAHKQHIIQ